MENRLGCHLIRTSTFQTEIIPFAPITPLAVRATVPRVITQYVKRDYRFQDDRTKVLWAGNLRDISPAGRRDCGTTADLGSRPLGSLPPAPACCRKFAWFAWFAVPSFRRVVADLRPLSSVFCLPVQNQGIPGLSRANQTIIPPSPPADSPPRRRAVSPYLRIPDSPLPLSRRQPLLRISAWSGFLGGAGLASAFAFFTDWVKAR